MGRLLYQALFHSLAAQPVGLNTIPGAAQGRSRGRMFRPTGLSGWAVDPSSGLAWISQGLGPRLCSSRTISTQIMSERDIPRSAIVLPILLPSTLHGSDYGFTEFTMFGQPIGSSSPYLEMGRIAQPAASYPVREH